jgi:hypothetical protein
MAKFTTKVFSRVKNVPQPDSAAILTVPVDIDFPSVNFSVGDIIELIETPAGVATPDYAFVFPDIDSNGTPTFAFSIGVLNAGSTDLATVYASGLTAGQSNAIVRAPNSDAAQASTATARRLGLKVTAVCATYAGATKVGQLLLSLRG